MAPSLIGLDNIKWQVINLKFYNDEKFGYRNIKITTIIAKTVCFLNNKLFEKKKTNIYWNHVQNIAFLSGPTRFNLPRCPFNLSISSYRQLTAPLAVFTVINLKFPNIVSLFFIDFSSRSSNDSYKSSSKNLF